jgi:hypothetical protein
MGLSECGCHVNACVRLATMRLLTPWLIFHRGLSDLGGGPGGGGGVRQVEGRHPVCLRPPHHYIPCFPCFPLLHTITSLALRSSRPLPSLLTLLFRHDHKPYDLLRQVDSSARAIRRGIRGARPGRREGDLATPSLPFSVSLLDHLATPSLPSSLSILSSLLLSPSVFPLLYCLLNAHTHP